MSQFSYTLPSGDEFVVNGPAGATQSDADRIFYEQVAAGALVGYSSGQTLTSLATQVTKFELSRLERGTAGVQDNIVLSITQGLPVTSSDAGLGIGLGLGATTSAVETVLESVQNLPRPVSMPNLSATLITNAINEADIVLAKGDSLGPVGVGPLSSYQIQKLLAQMVNLVVQPSDEISQEKGIGKYGFDCYVLEQIGYVKPGTSNQYLLNTPEDFVAVMSTPSVWTGKNGVYSLEDLLNDPEIQNFIQVELMQQGYDSLTAAGIITVPVEPSIKLSSGQVFTTSGLQTVSALTVLGTIQSASSGSISNLLSTSQALTTQISNLSTIGSGAINNLTAGLGSLGNLANLDFTRISVDLKNRITGDVGALITNASKFGTQVTGAWAKAGNISLAGIGTTVTGTLSNLTSNLNLYGKASQFATNFANPLSGITSLGNVGALQGQLTGALGGLQGQLTGALGGLQGQLTGALGNLGGLANLGNLGSIFGGGGDLVSGTQVAAGFSNTVNRKTVDAAFSRILGNSKIPVPVYEYPGFSALSSRLDIKQAQTILSDRNNTFGQSVTI
jgi:hypothetical protein